MSNPRRPHTPDEFTLEMKADVERLRIEIILLQPAPPQCDPLPRRAAVGTGSDEPGVSRLETPTEKEDILPLETGMDDVLHFNCLNP